VLEQDVGTLTGLVQGQPRPLLVYARHPGPEPYPQREEPAISPYASSTVRGRGYPPNGLLAVSETSVPAAWAL